GSFSPSFQSSGRTTPATSFMSRPQNSERQADFSLNSSMNGASGVPPLRAGASCGLDAGFGAGFDSGAPVGAVVGAPVGAVAGGCCARSSGAPSPAEAKATNTKEATKRARCMTISALRGPASFAAPARGIKASTATPRMDEVSARLHVGRSFERDRRLAALLDFYVPLRRRGGPIHQAARSTVGEVDTFEQCAVLRQEHVPGSGREVLDTERPVRGESRAARPEVAALRDDDRSVLAKSFGSNVRVEMRDRADQRTATMEVHLEIRAPVHLRGRNRQLVSSEILREDADTNTLRRSDPRQRERTVRVGRDPQL